MWLVVRWGGEYYCLVATCHVMSCQSSTTNVLQYYKILLQNYSVLQSTTPVLLCTTKYNSSTTLYYKVLLHYYSSITKYYSSTSLYYKVLFLIDPWRMKRHLQCAEQQESSSNFTKYCACHAKWISWLIRITYETSITMRGATRVILQLHQILRLPRKMNLMIDPHHIWKVIYNARSNKSHPPTSPNTAPATQNESHDWSASHMKRHLQCAEQQESSSNFTKYCACHARWISWLIRITYETSFTMRGATRVILQPHQILRLPRKMNFMLNSLHTWNAIYNARCDKQHPPTSPNTAPATKNESHAEFSSHMKRYLQCAEREATSSNLTKYCACHEKWPSKIWEKFGENRWNVISNARPIREWSENDPRPFRAWSDHENAKLNPPRRRGYFRARQKQILLKITTFRAPAIIPNFTEYCACHEKWHFNFTKYCACHEK